MKNALILVLVLTSYHISAQSHQVSNTVIFQIDNGQIPLPGVSIFIPGQDPASATISDINGRATITIPAGINGVHLNFLGPPTRVPIPNKVDSVYVNMQTRKVRYFNAEKVISRKKLKIG